MTNFNREREELKELMMQSTNEKEDLERRVERDL